MNGGKERRKKEEEEEEGIQNKDNYWSVNEDGHWRRYVPLERHSEFTGRRFDSSTIGYYREDPLETQGAGIGHWLFEEPSLLTTFTRGHFTLIPCSEWEAQVLVKRHRDVSCESRKKLIIEVKTLNRCEDIKVYVLMNRRATLIMAALACILSHPTISLSYRDLKCMLVSTATKEKGIKGKSHLHHSCTYPLSLTISQVLAFGT